MCYFDTNKSKAVIEDEKLILLQCPIYDLYILNKKKKKLYTYLFSHISANTYPRNIILISNKSVFNPQQTCVNETQM